MGYLLTLFQRNRNFILLLLRQPKFYVFKLLLSAKCPKRDFSVKESTENTSQCLITFEVNVEILLSYRTA